MKHILRQVLEHVRSGKKTVLATVTRSTGSTPQKPGSSALFGEEGLLAGTVGGGLLEGRVQSIAGEAMASGLSGQYVFNLDSRQGQEGTLCGGEATVLVDANPGAFLEAFEQAERSVDRRSGGILLTMFRNGKANEKKIERFWVKEEDLNHLPESIVPAARDAIKERLRRGTSRDFLELTLPPGEKVAGEYVFLERIRPLPRLIVAGAGHVGKAVAHMGSLLDFEITVVDDRKEFANRENIPDADHLVVRDIGQAMREMRLGDDTYVVIATRGHDHDAEALKPCIGSGAAYVGMIGSRHKVGVMRKQFLEQGWATPEQWAAIHTPIGLEIGSQTVQEIAVSIAAQLVIERNRQKRKMKHDRTIILAAGSSQRMKTQKLLLPYRGSTIIETVIRNVLQSGVDSVMVVLGAGRDKVLKAIGDVPVSWCYNEHHARGMLSSVICGFRALPEDTGAVLVFLGDQPDIPPDVTNRLIEAFHNSSRGIVIPLHKGQRGHPLLVDMKYRDAIEKLDPELGLRSLMDQFPDDVLEIEVGDPGIHMDIDTPEDYLNATQ